MSNRDPRGSRDVVPPWDEVDVSDRIEPGDTCFVVAPLLKELPNDRVLLPLVIVKTTVVAQVLGRGAHLLAYQVNWWVNDVFPGPTEVRGIHPGLVHSTREKAEAHLEAKLPSILGMCREGAVCTPSEGM